jgi:hypothetical protein
VRFFAQKKGAGSRCGVTNPKDHGRPGDVLLRVPPKAVPQFRRAAARQILRMLTLRLNQAIDDTEADLRTLAEQTRQAGALAVAELEGKP